MITLRDPRYTLLDAPTTLQRLDRLAAHHGRRAAYLKRDDLMSRALGGNKLRSLEFWLGAALAAGADMLVVAGGALSNQCRLTAAAAAVSGLDCLILHSATGDDRDRRASFLNRVLGADVRFIGAVDEDERGRIAAEAVAELRRRGRRPYLIGDPVVGALGYVVAAAELLQQAHAVAGGIRHVFLPGSMGPTEAGFLFGNAVLGSPFSVHLVSVEYGEAELLARVAQIYDGLARHTGLEVPPFSHQPIECHMTELGDGYGVPTAAAEAALLTFARTEAVFLEHTYMAKTAAGFLAFLRRQPPHDGGAACLFHTGGTATLFQQFDQFRSVRPDDDLAAWPEPAAPVPIGGEWN